MEQSTLQNLQYPIGKFSVAGPITETQVKEYISIISQAPAQLRLAVKGLSSQQLETPYRPGGWTVRQVVHHVADSHMNAYIRFKLALTEEEPTIKPYREDQWALLADTQITHLEVSLTLLEALHERWVVLLQSMSSADFKRTYRHPESGVQPLERVVGLYAWHGQHHIAHITSLRTRMGW